MNMSPSREVHSTDVTLYVVSLGVSGAVVVLIVAAAIVIICLRMRLCKHKPASFKSEDTYDEHTYDYISTTDEDGVITTLPNEAYAATDSSPNPAYGMVHTSIYH